MDDPGLDPTAPLPRRPLRPFGVKTPEQLAHDLEERALDQARREVEARRQWRWTVARTLAVGAGVPTAMVWVMGASAAADGWLLDGGGWQPVLTIALLGGLGAGVALWRGLSIPLCLVLYGVLASLLIAFGGGVLHIASRSFMLVPMLICVFVGTGALVGWLGEFEE